MSQFIQCFIRCKTFVIRANSRLNIISRVFTASIRVHDHQPVYDIFLPEAIFFITSGSPCSTPGKFIISLRYFMSGLDNKRSTSAGCKCGAGCFKISSRHTTGGTKIKIKRCLPAVFNHEFHAGHTQHIGDFMWITDCCNCSMNYRQSGKFRRQQAWNFQYAHVHQ